MGLPPAFGSSTGLQQLSTLLTDQFLAPVMLSGGTGLGCLLDHAGAQAIHVLIDRLFNLGQRRFGVCRSPLGHGGEDVLALFFPPLL
jgi:hypothetical protein